MDLVRCCEAGNSGVYVKEKKEVLKVEKQNINANAWKTRELTFDDLELKDVIPTIERYFWYKSRSGKSKRTKMPCNNKPD